jgi:AraC-like DNA-binding protein
MDVLSGVLRSVRLEGALYLDAEFTAPWCMRGRFALTSVKERLANAERVMLFHYLVEGSARVRLVEGNEVLELNAGDLVMFPQDDRHLMGSDLHVAPLEADHLAGPANVGVDDFIPIRHGGGGARTRFVCGYMAWGSGTAQRLFESLPRVLRITMGDGPAARLLRELLKLGVRESAEPRPGAQSTLARLADLMVVEALRVYAEQLPSDGTGWLAGLRDLHVGRALAALHAEPDRKWTVDELARSAALSRSALAERFTRLVGSSPMQYLTRWRLAQAADQLRAGSDSVARVAERSGYETEAAFSRAFKREFGVPPAAWRRHSLVPDKTA